MMVGGGCRAEGNKGEKKWDNCNSIINKIYFLKANNLVKKYFRPEQNRHLNKEETQMANQ